MILEATQYKELNNIVVVQYQWVPYTVPMTLNTLYGGLVNSTPALSGNVAEILIPTSLQTARAYRILWNPVVQARVAGTGPVPLAAIPVTPIVFKAVATGDLSFNDIPYGKEVNPKFPFMSMTDNLNKIVMRNLMLLWAMNVNDLAPNANFIPAVAGATQLNYAFFPVVHAIF